MKKLEYNGQRNICGEHVRLERLKKRISQEKLAARLQVRGVNIRVIQKFESRERGIETASLAVALRIADVLGVHPRDLI